MSSTAVAEGAGGEGCPSKASEKKGVPEEVVFLVPRALDSHLGGLTGQIGPTVLTGCPSSDE